MRNAGKFCRATLQMCIGCGLLAIAGVVTSAQVRAQDSEKKVTQDGGLDEIVVTARRRSEDLSKVPTSVSVLDSKDLQEKMVLTEADLQRSVPGLVVRESLTENQISFVIRGQTFDPFSSSPPAVLPYYNEVPMAPVGANEFYDLESIQVLKGPQGTLFGRNTTGGAVLFETSKPKSDFGGYALTRVGNYDTREFEGAINLPLVPDTVLVRIATKLNHKNGYIHNLMLDEDLGEQDSASGRISVTVKPVAGLENTTMYQYSDDHGRPVGGLLYSVNKCGTPGLVTGPDCAYGPANNPFFASYVAANPGLFAGGLSAYLTEQQKLGYYNVNQNSPAYYGNKSQFATNTTKFDINDHLLLKNVAGLYDGSLYESIDVDGSPYPIFNYGPVGASTAKTDDTREWSEELQLQGNAFQEKLQYIVGGFYSKANLEQYNPQTFFGFEPLAPAATQYIENDRKDISKALFAQATDDLSALGLEGLSVTAGIRQTWEDVSLHQLSRSVYFGLPDLSTTFSVPSWQFGLDYKPTQELLIYVVQRGSWRSGGFNAFSSPAVGAGFTLSDGIEFRKETVRDIEFGVKFQGTVAGAPARLNVATYYEITDDVQRNLAVNLGGGPGSATVNVPQAKVDGLEADGEIKPFSWLLVGGNVAYTNARFSKPTTTVAGVSTTFGPFPDSPHWSTSFFSQVFFPVPADIGKFSVRGDVYHQTKSYFSSLEATIIPGTELPGYTLANFRMELNDIAASRLSAALFINNAFAERYLSGGLALGALFGLNVATVGHPQTYGAELSYRF